MLTIRLQRTGKKHAANFRIVVAEKTAHVTKKVTEMLGSYNPSRKDFKVNEERVKYWVGQHVAMSPTVHNLFVDKGLLKADKVKAFSVPKKEETKAEAPAEAPAAQAQAEAPAPEAAPETSAEQPAEESPKAE